MLLRIRCPTTSSITSEFFWIRPCECRKVIAKVIFPENLLKVILFTCDCVTATRIIAEDIFAEDFRKTFKASMKPFKYTVLSKYFHRLSARQWRRIISEIKDTLRLNISQDFVTPEQSDNAASYMHVADTFRNEVPFTILQTIFLILMILAILIMIYCLLIIMMTVKIPLPHLSLKISFQDRFANNNLTHVQSNNILSVLRTHTCFSSLPKDVRTLLKTSRTPTVISKIDLGKYIHFSLGAGIVKILLRLLSVSISHELKIDFNTDGCSLDKSGNIHIWPIQCRFKYKKKIIYPQI